MADTVIRVENLSKRYILNHQQEGQGKYKTLQDTIVDGAKSLVSTIQNPLASRRKALSKIQNSSREEFWAVKDVSFEIKQGDRVGIIGRNGAGKSTLLKLLSRIVEPTHGQIEITGRVASLLEVGTGFHPELTGRENIYLNGAILGMGREEIKRKFDEIVAFAEVEKFLDTPVKRYSSGMYVRLAFAVAAHLEPEILIVDEVLAVGDAQFQKKCLGKMEDVGKEGRTVIFVSHNVAAIRQLCSTCILLDQGRIQAIGATEQLVSNYTNSSFINASFADLYSPQAREGNQKVMFKWAKISTLEGITCNEFSIGDSFQVQFAVIAKQLCKSLKFSVTISLSDGTPVCNIVDADSGFDPGILQDSGVYILTFKDIRLYPDTYYLDFWAANKTDETYDHIKGRLSFSILDGGKLTMRSLPRSSGLLFLTPDWKMEPNI